VKPVPVVAVVKVMPVADAMTAMQLALGTREQLMAMVVVVVVVVAMVVLVVLVLVLVVVVVVVVVVVIVMTRVIVLAVDTMAVAAVAAAALTPHTTASMCCQRLPIARDECLTLSLPTISLERSSTFHPFPKQRCVEHVISCISRHMVCMFVLVLVFVRASTDIWCARSCFYFSFCLF
jgi:hypothetical protein